MKVEREFAESRREDRIFAIDPGTSDSGYCVVEGKDEIRVIASGVMENEQLLNSLEQLSERAGLLAIEMFASYGMPVGREVFETCVYIGRLVERWPGEVRLVYRKDVKLHLCGQPRAKDPNVRQALLDLVGPAGTKAAPGPTYGVRSHAWSALAIAVTSAQTRPS